MLGWGRVCDLAGRDEIAHDSLLLVGLLVEPAGEEGHLDVGEAPLRVLRQLRDDAREDVLHGGVLDRVVGAVVVLVDRLQPPDLLRGGNKEYTCWGDRFKGNLVAMGRQERDDTSSCVCGTMCTFNAVSL